jgi:hypothetical protein
MQIATYLVNFEEFMHQKAAIFYWPTRPYISQAKLIVASKGTYITLAGISCK